MTDLDTRIRTSLTRLADEMTPIGAATDDLLATIADRRHTRRRTRRVATVMGSIVLAVAVGAVAATALDGRADDTHIVTTPDPTTETTLEPTPDPPEVTTTGAEAPLSPRAFAATAWTGSELVVWGGLAVEPREQGQVQALLDDGAAYDPTTDAWRVMAPWPTDRQPSPFHPRSVATDTEVVVFRGQTSASWDPRSNTWRELPDAPVPVGQAIWTGSEIVVATSPIQGPQGNVMAALDPVPGTWRALPSPGELEETVIAWTGAEVIALGREAGVSRGNVEARAFDPADGGWRELSTGPLLAMGFSATWVEDRLMVVNYRSEATTYDPSTDAWTTISPLPGYSGEVWTVPATIGEHVVVSAGHLTFVGDRQGNWTPLPPTPRYRHERMVPIGEEAALVVTFMRADPIGELSPPTVEDLDLDDLLNPEMLWFGDARLVLGDDITFVRQELIGDPSVWQHAGALTTVSVVGQECTITARYGEAVVGTPAGDPVEISPVHAGAPWTGYLQDGSRTLRLPEGATWLECNDPDGTLTLARALVRDESGIDEARRRAEAERAAEQARLAELQQQLARASEARAD